MLFEACCQMPNPANVLIALCARKADCRKKGSNRVTVEMLDLVADPTHLADQPLCQCSLARPRQSCEPDYGWTHLVPACAYSIPCSFVHPIEGGLGKKIDSRNREGYKRLARHEPNDGARRGAAQNAP